MKDIIKTHCESVILKNLLLMKKFDIIDQFVLKKAMNLISDYEHRKISTYNAKKHTKFKKVYDGIILNEVNRKWKKIK